MKNSASGKKANVIGSGFGGMASALRLRAKGWDVRLIERADDPGGRARQFEQDGYVFDAGPTVITAPHLFAELFELFGRNMTDYITMLPLDCWYRFVYEDDSYFNYAGPERTYAEIYRLAGDQGVEDYARYRAYCEQMFKLAYEDLADQPMHAITTTLHAVPAMARLQCYRTVYSQARRFFHDPRLQSAFSIQPLLLGGNPLSTTALYHLIHALEQRWGVHFARGGTGAIVRGLITLMKEVGIEVITGQSVHSIAHDGRRAHKVICDDGTRYICDMIVANTDPDHLYDDLLARRPRAPRPTKHSFSLYLLYFGTRCQYPDIPHHTILMGADYEAELKNLFGRQHFDPDNFSIYLHRPTATDPAMAPDGCDSFYALVAVPNLKAGINWDSQAGLLREAVINRLEARLLPGLRANLATELALDPRYFRDSLLSCYGAAFSIAPLFYQSGYFRYHNKVPGMENIYLAGAGTHPGAGIPGVLNSAKVVEKLAGAPA